MKRQFFIYLILILGQAVSAQKAENENLIIAYLNADKMYDIVDDEGSYDDPFTPSGDKFWGEQRYNDKLDRLEELILSINGKELPGILVISEIENKLVVDDLLKRKSLKKKKYKAYFDTHPGGKSSVLLSSVKLTGEQSLNIDTGAGAGINAAVSYSTFTLADGKKYHLFVNNWVERSGGSGGSEPARINCAVAVRKEIDRILNFERDARIIVMGTFWDEPTSRSIMAMLNASNKRKNIHYRDLFNPFYDSHNQHGEGTVEINGSMQMYDFIMVSPILLRSNDGYSCGFNPGKTSTAGSTTPLPTFRANDYKGGAGAHFPVSIQLSRSPEK